MDHEDVQSIGLTLHMARVLAAPPTLVFATLTDPEQLATWWGPTGFTVPQIDLDLAVGGSYRIGMQPPEGELFYLVGEYREIVPPVRLSYTFRWEPPDPEDQETMVSISLRDLGPSTELRLERGPFATQRRRALHDDGWTQSLDRLDQVLVAHTAGHREPS